jgi:DNA-directed RNA polymerase specialized sigma24 family protein
MSDDDRVDGALVRPFLDEHGQHAVVAEHEPEHEVALVRSYLMTGGRVAPSMELAFEALLSTTARGLTALETLAFERQAIVRLCRFEPQSVAEVSAKLGVPIGVVRVLAGDLASESLLDVQAATENVADDVSLILRLIEGVRAL